MIKIEEIYELFNFKCKDRSISVPEITMSELQKIVEKYLSFDRYTDAENYMCNCIDDYIENTYDRINRDAEDYRESFEYKEHIRHMEAGIAIYSLFSDSHLSDEWIRIHGKTHTLDEAATIAANKWGELLFNFHLQDNGALDEEHSFNASMLATYLSERAKKEISYDVKKKVINLFKEYYKHYVIGDNDWCKKNLPDPKGRFDWNIMGQPYCDYHPNYYLYLILLNGGVDEKTIDNICPWKTGIDIRFIDNGVLYRTYQKKEEI